jgi:hypothetical protein
MMPIVLGDLAWQTTFPHQVAPLPDEWLTGLLLRCDEVNHWESGETFRYLLHSTDHPGFGPDASLLVVPFSLLECLAQFLMVSPKRLLATTYSAELARLYPSDEPHPKFLLGPQYHSEKRLRRFRRGQRELSRKRPIHLCPVCVAQTRMIKRTEALPHLHYCPIHHVAFQGRCSCGTPLSFFSRGTPPFACSGCGLDWGEFPHISISPDRLKLEHDLYALYEFFLLQGTDELKGAALRLARHQIKKHESLQSKLSGRRIMLRSIPILDHLSLGYIVDILVSVGISPKDIAEVSLC